MGLARSALIVLLLGVGSGAAEAQIDVTPDQTYLLLATSRTSTLQDEVSEAVAAGYVMSSLVSCSEHIALMERQAPERAPVWCKILG